MTAEAEPLVIFTPSGRRGHFPAGTTVLDAARSLGVDIDSVCGGRGICGRCQVTQGLGEFPKHGITSAPGHLSPFAELETAYREEKGLAADRRLSCTATVCGDVLVDVPPESQVHRQVVRKGLDVRTFTVDPVVRLHYVEVVPPELASPTGDLARLFEALEREWQLTDLDGGPRGRPRAPARARGRQVPGHRRRPRGTPGDRRLAGPPRQGLRRRHRRRLHHHRRPPRRPRRRLDPREQRRDEPADPLRRGPDEPGLLRDDASRGGRRDDGGRAQGAGRADRHARDAGRDQAGGDPRAGHRRQPDHAPPGPGHRPDAARRRAVRAGDRPRGHDRPRRARAARPSRRPRRTCCRASPATSGPTRPA